MKLKIQTYYHSKFIAILFLISCSFWFKIASSNTMIKNIKNYNPDNKQLMKNSSKRKLNNYFKNKSNNFNKKTIKLKKLDSKMFEKSQKALINTYYKNKYNKILKLEKNDVIQEVENLCKIVKKDFNKIKDKIGNVVIYLAQLLEDKNLEKIKKKKLSLLTKKFDKYFTFVLDIERKYRNLIYKLKVIKNTSNQFKNKYLLDVSHDINIFIQKMFYLPEFFDYFFKLSDIKYPLNNIIRSTMLNILIVCPKLFVKIHKNIRDNNKKNKDTISSKFYERLSNLVYILGKNLYKNYMKIN